MKRKNCVGKGWNNTSVLKNFFCREKVDGKISPLSENSRCGRKKICKITGDRKMCARMAALGMYPGEEINVICATKGSRCILRTAGGTISLDPLTSENILVEAV